MLIAKIAHCSGQEPTDIPHATPFANQAAPEAVDAGEDLQDLIGELDALIGEA